MGSVPQPAPDRLLCRAGRQHISKLIEPGGAAGRGRKADEPVIASLTPSKPPSPSGSSSEEQRAWDRIKDSSNAAAFRDFIRRYPSSVLSNTAQTRLEALERAAQEREEKARAEREAKAAEAERQQAERDAALKRAEEERQAKAAEEGSAQSARPLPGRPRAQGQGRRSPKRAEEDRLARLSDTERQGGREAAARKAEEERKAKAEEDGRRRLLRPSGRRPSGKPPSSALRRNDRQARRGCARQARAAGRSLPAREALLATLKGAADSQAWAREDLKRPRAKPHLRAAASPGCRSARQGAAGTGSQDAGDRRTVEARRPAHRT